jgi:hypothetical protein
MVMVESYRVVYVGKVSGYDWKHGTRVVSQTGLARGISPWNTIIKTSQHIKT